ERGAASPRRAEGRRSEARHSEGRRTGPRTAEARPTDARPAESLAAVRTRLRALVEPVVSAAGLELEDLGVSRAGRRHVVRVAVEGDDGVGHDELSDVSHRLSVALDEAEATGGELALDSYALEVSSPGVDRPLTQPRHWRRNTGRLVTVRVAERTIT